MERANEAPEAIGGLVGTLVRRTRSGNRVWSPEIKGRAVFESMKPGARVCDVAQRYGVKAQQVTAWRRLARKGQIALVADEATDFVEIEVSAPEAPCKATPIEISFGRVSVRVDATASSARIAEIVTAIERSA
jgi:transposase